METDRWDRGAELLNSYRVVPRLVLVVYYTFFVHAWYYVVDWFIKIDWNALPTDPLIGAAAATATAGFPAVILGILSKILKELTESYWGGSSSPKGPGH